MCLAKTLLRELILSVRLVARVFSAKLSLGEGSKSMPWKPEENGLSYSRWSPRMPGKRRVSWSITGCSGRVQRAPIYYIWGESEHFLPRFQVNEMMRQDDQETQAWEIGPLSNLTQWLEGSEVEGVLRRPKDSS